MLPLYHIAQPDIWSQDPFLAPDPAFKFEWVSEMGDTDDITRFWGGSSSGT